MNRPTTWPIVLSIHIGLSSGELSTLSSSLNNPFLLIIKWFEIFFSCKFLFCFVFEMIMVIQILLYKQRVEKFRFHLENMWDSWTHIVLNESVCWIERTKRSQNKKAVLHYGRRLRGCRFRSIGLQETKNPASWPFTLEAKVQRLSLSKMPTW
jgi:hypothetical protein